MLLRLTGYRHLQMLGVICFSLLLFSCAVKKRPVAMDTDTPQESALRKQLQSWVAEGSLVGRAHARPVTVQFRFVQCGPHHYDVQFFGPLRITLARIKKENGQLTIDAQGKKVQLTSMSALQEFSKRIPIPIDDFKNWLKGMAIGESQHKSSQAGLLQSLRYGEWILKYQNYAWVNWPQHGTLRLPDRIDFVNEAKQVEGKIRVHTWQLQTEQVCRR